MTRLRSAAAFRHRFSLVLSPGLNPENYRTDFLIVKLNSLHPSEEATASLAMAADDDDRSSRGGRRCRDIQAREGLRRYCHFHPLPKNKLPRHQRVGDKQAIDW